MLLFLILLLQLTNVISDKIVSIIDFDLHSISPKYIVKTNVTYYNDNNIAKKLSRSINVPFRICEHGYYILGDGYNPDTSFKYQLYNTLCDATWNNYTNEVTRVCKFICDTHFNYHRVNPYIKDYMEKHNTYDNNNNIDVEIVSKSIYQKFFVTIDYNKYDVVSRPILINITRMFNNLDLHIYSSIYVNLLNAYILCENNIDDGCEEYECEIRKDKEYNIMYTCTTLCKLLC
jgi:hypothetical protein